MDSLYKVISAATKEVGLRAFRSDARKGSSEKLRKKIMREIDESLFVIVEGSVFSWYVAFELTYAMQKEKPLVILVQEPKLECMDSGKDVRALLSDYTYEPYSLPLHNEGALKAVIKKALKTELSKLYDSTPSLMHRLESLPLHRLAKMPEPYVSQMIRWRKKLVEEDEFFKKWQRMERDRSLVGVISPPGWGKTVLLSKLQSLIGKGRDAKSRRHAFAVRINLGYISDPKSIVDENWPWELIKSNAILGDIIGNPDDSRYCGLVDMRCRKGDVYFFMDGLDEFGSRHKAQLGSLLERCNALSKEGHRVMLSCRERYWKSEVLTRDSNISLHTARIQHLSVKQAKKLVSLDLLPTSAKVMKGGKVESLKTWIGYPLLLSFIAQGKKSIRNRGSFKTKTDVYDRWSSYIAGTDAKRINAKRIDSKVDKERLVDLFGELALLLARERRQDIDRDLCVKAINRFSVAELGGAIESPELMTSRFLERGDSRNRVDEDQTRFIHESLYEFFVAKRMVTELDNLLKIKDPTKLFTFKKDHKLITGPLARTPLDYVYSSVYGFLSESLDAGAYAKDAGQSIGDLLDWLETLDRKVRMRYKSPPCRNNVHIWELIRNVVEYIGQTIKMRSRLAAYTKEGKKVLVMLDLVENKKLNMLVRYNAARALERMHPSGPQPYFEFMSDWRVGHKAKRRFDMSIYGWAVRGGGLAKRRLGKSPPMAINFTWGTKNSVDNRLQSVVSARLLKCIIDRDSSIFLSTNCSYALLRWFADDRQNQELLKEAIQKVNTRIHNPRRETTIKSLKCLHENLSKLLFEVREKWKIVDHKRRVHLSKRAADVRKR
jgi:hypothetical protein